MVRSIGRTGIRRIVALRGDPPGGGTRYGRRPGAMSMPPSSSAASAALGDFEISVAAYPEKPPGDSFTLEVDLAMLAAKVDNGATSALTQFFFDNSRLFPLRRPGRARGIDIPIIPGILPVTNFERVRQVAERCGARLTAAFARRFEGLENAPEERRLVAAAVAAEQVTALRAEGVNSFHF